MDNEKQKIKKTASSPIPIKNDTPKTKIIKLDTGDYVEINLETGKKYLLI